MEETVLPVLRCYGAPAYRMYVFYGIGAYRVIECICSVRTVCLILKAMSRDFWVNGTSACHDRRSPTAS